MEETAFLSRKSKVQPAFRPRLTSEEINRERSCSASEGSDKLSTEHILGGKTHSHGDSTSENSNSQQALTFEELTCKPLTDLLKVPTGQSETFVIDSTAGLSGAETVCEFACLLNQDSKQFFVWFCDTDFNLFSKSTLMNLCDFAEKRKAQSLTFVCDRNHPEKMNYSKTFKVIDAKRIPRQESSALLKQEMAHAAKEFNFYQMEL